MSEERHEDQDDSVPDLHEDVDAGKKKSKKHHNHKRGSMLETTNPERSKKYGKEKDMFPELTAMPEFAAYRPGKGGDDDSWTTAATRYDTKEDQDVAVFMALAGRMNIDSLLFILNGHAREMNLPSADLLLPENADKLRAAREAARKKKKVFQWKEDSEGQVALEVWEIEPMKDADMWFDDEFSQRILMSAIRDVRYYQANKPDYIAAVETLAIQPKKGQATTEALLKTIINDKHARGLEVHICSTIEQVRKEYTNAVLDQQDECEDAGEPYDVIADRLRAASLQYTVQSQEFANMLAKCDHIVALKASLSKWDKPKTSKKKPVSSINRCSNKEEKEGKRSSKEATVV